MWRLYTAHHLTWRCVHVAIMQQAQGASDYRSATCGAVFCSQNEPTFSARQAKGKFSGERRLNGNPAVNSCLSPHPLGGQGWDPFYEPYIGKVDVGTLR